jgi:hypothetical protein
MPEPSNGCGLYRCYDAQDRLLYVGITNLGLRRWRKHTEESAWWPDVARIDVEHHTTREQAMEREATLIRALEPLYNHQHAAGVYCPDCERRMTWRQMTTPQSVREHDGRVYQGAWLCEQCHDYDALTAPPPGAALDPIAAVLALHDDATYDEAGESRRALAAVREAWANA